MANTLQIYDPRERALVRLADALLSPLRLLPRRRAGREVRRVLLLRLERIGDLLMVLPALGDARAAWPDARIDLAVGGWNAELAALIPGVNEVRQLDAPWLARERRGRSWPALLAAARRWRDGRYDLVINFEPDIRSNLLAWLSGAPRRAGYGTGGGGALLTDAAVYDPGLHVAVNARRLVARAAGREAPAGAAGAGPRLAVPEAAAAEADALVGSGGRPLIGVHPSGGRESKQWHPDRFAAVARELAASHGATIVLTGGPGDRALVDAVRRDLAGVPVVDACGILGLAPLAALLSRLDLLVTGDTGPMHLAAAMDTPIVAIFGPSQPWRYGPLSARHRVVRIDLPCSPCGQVRLPPARCRGHVPDCLDGIDVAAVVRAARELLPAPAGAGARA